MPGPYIFVGREEGGQISKAAAMISPASTAGLVLIDSYPFKTEQELEGQMLGYDAYQQQYDNIRTYDVARAFEVTGFSRYVTTSFLIQIKIFAILRIRISVLCSAID